MKDIPTGDSNATEENVLIAFRPDWRVGDPRREDITKERFEAWRAQGGRDWRIAKELLWNKLDFYFTEPRKSQLLSSFEVVLNRSEDIASRIGGLVAQYNNNVNVRPNDAFQKEIRGIFDQIYKNRDDLRQMDKLILEDIEKDAQVPHTLWDYVM